MINMLVSIVLICTNILNKGWLALMLVKNGLLSRMDRYHSFAEEIFPMTYGFMLVTSTLIWKEKQDTWSSSVSDFKDIYFLIKTMGTILGKLIHAKRLY